MNAIANVHLVRKPLSSIVYHLIVSMYTIKEYVYPSTGNQSQLIASLGEQRRIADIQLSLQTMLA